MKTEHIDPIEKGNPFLSDLTRMGVEIDNNITALFSEHKDNKEIILVDIRTGERLKVFLNEKEFKQFEEKTLPDGRTLLQVPDAPQNFVILPKLTPSEQEELKRVARDGSKWSSGVACQVYEHGVQEGKRQLSELITEKKIECERRGKDLEMKWVHSDWHNTFIQLGKIEETVKSDIGKEVILFDGTRTIVAGGKAKINERKPVYSESGEFVIGYEETEKAIEKPSVVSAKVITEKDFSEEAFGQNKGLTSSEQKELEHAEAEMRHIHRHSDETMTKEEAEKEWDKWRAELKAQLIGQRGTKFKCPNHPFAHCICPLHYSCDGCPYNLELNQPCGCDTSEDSPHLQKDHLTNLPSSDVPERETEMKNSVTVLASNFLQTLSSNPDKDKYSDKDIRKAIEIGLSKGMQKMDELVFTLTHGKWCVHEEHAVEGSVVIGVPDLLKLVNSPKGEWQNTVGDKCPICSWTLCKCDDGSQYCQSGNCSYFYPSDEAVGELLKAVLNWERLKGEPECLAIDAYKVAFNRIVKAGWEPHKKTMLGVDRPHTVHLAMGGGGWTNTQEPCSGKLVKDENGKITCTSCDIELKEMK